MIIVQIIFQRCEIFNSNGILTMWRRYIRGRRAENPWEWESTLWALKYVAIPAYLICVPAWASFKFNDQFDVDLRMD